MNDSLLNDNSQKDKSVSSKFAPIDTKNIVSEEDCKALAKHYFTYNHELIKRLFMTMPTSIVLDGTRINKPDGVFNVFDFFAKLEDKTKRTVYYYLLELLSLK